MSDLIGLAAVALWLLLGPGLFTLGLACWQGRGWWRLLALLFLIPSGALIAVGVLFQFFS